MKWLAACVAAALVAACAPPLARADEPAAAEHLFRQGRALLSAGHLAEACGKFEESYHLDPALGTLLNLAKCHEELGKIATAWGEYATAAESAARSKETARRDFAKQHADALAPRLPKLVVVAPRIEGIQIRRDGVVIGAGSLGEAIPIDPGEHTLEARAPGHADWVKKITAREGARERVVVPELEPKADVEPPPQPVSVGAPPPVVAPPPMRDGSAQRIAGFAVGGAGVVALAIGGVFIGLTGAKKSEANNHCDANKRCDPTGLSAIDAAKTDAWVADFTLLGGAGLIAAGSVIVLTSPRPEARALAVGPRGVSLSLAF